MTQVGNNSGGLGWLFDNSGKIKDRDQEIPGQAPLPGDLDKKANALPEPASTHPEPSSSTRGLPVRFSNQTTETQKTETGNRSWDLTSQSTGSKSNLASDIQPSTIAGTPLAAVELFGDKSLGLKKEQFTSWQQALAKETITGNDPRSELLKFIKNMQVASTNNLSGLKQKQLVKLIAKWHETSNSSASVRLKSADDILKIALAQHNDYVLENGNLIESSKATYYHPSNKPFSFDENISDSTNVSTFKDYTSLSSKILSYLDHNGNVRLENKADLQRDLKTAAEIHQSFLKHVQKYPHLNDIPAHKLFLDNKANNEAETLEAVISIRKGITTNVAKAKDLWTNQGVKEIFNKIYTKTDHRAAKIDGKYYPIAAVVKEAFPQAGRKPLKDKHKLCTPEESLKLSNFLDATKTLANCLGYSSATYKSYTDGEGKDHELSRLYQWLLGMQQAGIVKAFDSLGLGMDGSQRDFGLRIDPLPEDQVIKVNIPHD